MKGSDNVMGADDQQERLKTVGWVVGFVDGEGCFSVAIQRIDKNIQSFWNPQRLYARHPGQPG